MPFPPTLVKYPDTTKLTGLPPTIKCWLGIEMSVLAAGHGSGGNGGVAGSTVTVNLSEAEQVASSSPLMTLTMMLPECPSFRGVMVSTLPVRLSDTAFCVESAKEIAKVSPGSMFIKLSETLILTGLPPTTIFRSDRRSSSFTIGQGGGGGGG